VVVKITHNENQPHKLFFIKNSAATTGKRVQNPAMTDSNLAPDFSYSAAA
jgi:hypothetical protein